MTTDNQVVEQVELGIVNEYIDEIHQISVVIIIELVVLQMGHILTEAVQYQVVVKLVPNLNMIVVEVMYEQKAVVLLLALHHELILIDHGDHVMQHVDDEQCIELNIVIMIVVIVHKLQVRVVILKVVVFLLMDNHVC